MASAVNRISSRFQKHITAAGAGGLAFLLSADRHPRESIRSTALASGHGVGRLVAALGIMNSSTTCAMAGCRLDVAPRR